MRIQEERGMTPQNLENAKKVRDCIEYSSGKKAYEEGQGKEACPHVTGDGRRAGWFTGWLDARTLSKFGRLFKKYNLEFPAVAK